MYDGKDTKGQPLKVGQAYRVSADDCCVRLHFASRISQVVLSTEEDDVIEEVHFENGVEVDRFDGLYLTPFD